MQPQEHIDATFSAADIYGTDRDIDADKLGRLSLKGWKLAIKRVVQEFFSEGLLDLGALLTYFSVLSLAPALLVAYSLITLFLANDSLEVLSRATELVDQYVPEEQSEVVLNVLDAISGSAAGGRIGLFIGVFVALWTSSAYVRAFSRCANAVYGRTEGRTLIRQWGVMVVLNLGLLIGAILILLSLVINETLVMGILGPLAEPLRLTSVLSFLTETFIPVWNWVKWPVILLVLMVLVATLYHFSPNVKPLKFRWLSAGSVFAIIGIFLAGGVLDVYFTYFASFNSYGAVGSVMAIFIGLWIFNIVLIVGVKIDAEASRARQLQAGLPAEDANLVRPRSVRMVAKLEKQQRRLVEQARNFRDSQRLTESSEPDMEY